MSIDATRWAWTRRGLTSMQKLVLLALADRAGADDTSWPSVAVLEEDTGADRKAIFDAVASLKEAGLVEDTGDRKGRTGRVIVYHLIGVEHRTTGTVPEAEQFRKRNSSGFPLNSPENGTSQSSRKRDTEPISNNQSEPTNACAFATFWAAYPRKQDRAKAEKAFRRLGKADQEAAVADCATRYQDCDRQFVPYATTYLHGRRWEDPIERHETMPSSQDEWEQWGRSNGLPAGRTETYREWIPRLRQEWRKRHSA